MEKWSYIGLYAVILTVLPAESIAQGGNTCAQAAANPVQLPFSSPVQDLCGKGNDFTGAGAGNCFPTNLGAAVYGGMDYLHSFIAPSNGFISIQITNLQSNGFASSTATLFKSCPGSGSCIAGAIGTWNNSSPGYSFVAEVDSGQLYYVLMDAYVPSSFYKNCYKYRINISHTPATTQASCTNMGFDTGDFSGWIATAGKASTGGTGSQTPEYTINSIGVLSGRHTIFTGGNDPCGNFSRVAPGGNGFSVRLGNNTTGAEAEQLRQTFMVTPDNSSFTYKYAVVFQDPGHQQHEQPFFKAMLKDKNGDVITCSEFVVAAAANLPGFVNSSSCNGVKYKPWSTVNVDLSNYVGEPVTVEFTTGDCTHGGHYGYAYIDAFCSPSLIAANRDTICPGESILLQAPTGYATYQWNPGGSTSQNITVTPSVSTNYTLTLKSFNNCVSTYTIPITVAPAPLPDFTYDAPDCEQPVTFINTSQVTTGNINASGWSFGTAASPSSSAQHTNISVSYPGPGTYPVTLHATTQAGCTASVTKPVTVPPCVFSVRITGQTVCPGEPAFLSTSYSHGIPPYSLTWEHLSSYAADTLTVSPAHTTVYRITVTDADGYVATDTAVVKVAPPATISPQITPVSCYGAGDGSISLQLGGTPPYQLTWSNGANGHPLQNLAPGTYGVRVTDQHGCSDTARATITGPEPLTATALSRKTTCGQANGHILINAVGGGTGPYLYRLHTGSYQATPAFDNLPPGLYSISIKDAHDCLLEFTQQVDTLSYPQETTLSITDATCGLDNGRLQLTGIEGGIAPFQFSLNSGSYSELFLPLDLHDLPEGNYSLILKDSNGCEWRLDTLIRQWEGPQQIGMTLIPATCDLDNATIQIDSIHGGTQPLLTRLGTGNWMDTLLYTMLAPGLQQVTVRDSNGCTFDTLVTVPFIEKVSISVAGEHPVSCYNNSDGTVAAAIHAGSGPYRVRWNTGDTTLVAENLPAGTYEVQVTDQHDCSDSAQATVTGPEPLTATALSREATCGQANGQLMIQAVNGGAGPYVFMLNTGSYQASPDFYDLPKGFYTVTIKDSHDCLLALIQQVDTLSYPQGATLSVTDATCGLDNGRLQLTGIEGGIAPFQFSLNSGPYLELSFPHDLDDLPEGNYTLTLKDSNGCEWSLDALIRQWEGPKKLDIKLIPATCNLDNATIQVDSIHGGTPPLLTRLGTGNWMDALLYKLLAPGPQQVTVRDSNGCTLDTLVTVPFIEKVNISVNREQPVSCYNYSDGAVGVSIRAGSTPYRVRWNTGDTTLIAEDLPAGNYRVEVIDSGGCEATAMLELAQPDRLELHAGGPGYVCRGSAAQLSSSVQGGTGSKTILWEYNPHAGNNHPVIPDSSTWYVALATDERGCIARDSHRVLLRELPAGDIVSDVPAGCQSACANFSVKLQDGASVSDYLWEFPGGTTSKSAVERRCFQQPGNPEIHVTLTDAYGCARRLSGKGIIQIYPLPVAGFEASPAQADIFDPEIQFFQRAGTMQHYYWDFDDGSNSTRENPQHQYPDTGSYDVCLTVTSEHGCTDTYCEPVNILPVPVFYAPSAFTPNRDGRNEFFTVIASYVVEFKMEIFDRWGELLFISEEGAQGWDGTYRGQTVQADVYVWRVTLRNSLRKENQLYGRVMLLE